MKRALNDSGRAVSDQDDSPQGLGNRLTVSPDPLYIAGMPIVPADVQRAAELICEDARDGRSRVYVLVNAHSAKLRRESLGYAEVLFDGSRTSGLADGASVAAAARLLGYGPIGRAPGPDLLEACARSCAEESVSMFLLGGAEGVVAALAQALQGRYPALTLAGTATPPFGEWPEVESRRLVEAVRASGAQLLVMGVSAPKQEIWAYRFAEELAIPILCVGAAFDFNSGRKSRAPEWMRRLGIEWVHRLLTEPGRLWRRYLVGNTLFIADVVRFGTRSAASDR